MVSAVKVSVREAPPLMVLDIHGAVTGSADSALKDAYATASRGGARYLLLNLGGVEHMDSAGIAVLIGILTEARKHDQHLLITGLTSHYRKIFDLMGLRQYAPVFDSEEAAQQWVAQPD